MADESPPTYRDFPWRTAIAAGVLVVLALLALVAYFKTLNSGRDVVVESGRAMEAALRELPGIAEKFQRGTITTTFIEGIPESVSTRGDVLELATAQTPESFMRTDNRTTFWGWLDLGTTVSEIRVPVTFRYHLRLSDPWRLTTRDSVCVVLAPPIRPSNPPAIHTDQMEKRTESGWGRWNKAENLTELEKGLTPALEARAGDRRHLRLVREECRKSAAEYVRRWLLREDHWRKDRFTAIVVVFPDELEGDAALELERRIDPPTITFDPPVEAVR